ncbi:unnamed protein product [Trichogramma brassicae]|uniref:Density-regulated protein homolog n=2 Tax=Apocrita TaxID=7400 RepID=A0A6H5IAI1_9HYME|nr:unnamed protein product [Trichogramma brassicae]
MKSKRLVQSLNNYFRRMHNMHFFLLYTVICANPASEFLIEYFLENPRENFRDDNGYTYLHAACMSGNVTAVNLLLIRGVDVNLDSFKYSALHMAVQYRHLHVIQILLENGANPNQPDHELSMPLHALTRLCICQCTNGVTFCDKRKPVDDIVQMLIKYGADIEAQNRHGSRGSIREQNALYNAPYRVIFFSYMYEDREIINVLTGLSGGCGTSIVAVGSRGGGGRCPGSCSGGDCLRRGRHEANSEAGGDDEKKRQKRGGKGMLKTKKKEEVQKLITVSRAPRGKKKSVTVVTGLSTFDIDLKVAAKFFGSRFACGSSVTGEDEIVIQGDVKDDLFDVIPEKWPQIDEDSIDDLGDQKR